MYEKPTLKQNTEQFKKPFNESFDSPKKEVKFFEQKKFVFTHKNEVLNQQQIKDMRAKGGSYEYQKQSGDEVETRKDIMCGTQEIALQEISNILQDFHPSLEGFKFEEFYWPSKLDRIRFPKFGLDFKPEQETKKHQKYLIFFLGIEIGSLHFHPFGHADEIGKFKDKNSTQPHYNLDFYDYPNKGILKTHLTFIKN